MNRILFIMVLLLSIPTVLGASDLNQTGTVDASGYYESGSSTLSNDISGNAATASDLSCVDCIGVSEIVDAYLLNTGDTASGNYTFDTDTLHIDSTNDLVAIGTVSPNALYKLDVRGDVRISDDQPKITLRESDVGREWDIEVSGRDLQIQDLWTTAIPFLIEQGHSSTLLYLDNQSRVGVGIVNPDGTLHIQTASAGTITPVGWADDMIIENNDGGGLSILTPNSNSGYVVFGDPDDADAGAVIYDHGADDFSFKTNGTVDRLVINGQGNVGIGTDSPAYNIHVQDSSGTANIAVNGTSGSLILQDHDAAFDQQVVQLLDSAGKFRIRGLNDALSGETVAGITLNLSSGNVGIGTSSPGEMLELRDPTFTQLRFSSDGDTQLWDLGFNSNYDFQFRDESNSKTIFTIEQGAPADTLRLDSTGHVGIGTASPVSNLHISTVNSQHSGEGLLLQIPTSGVGGYYAGIYFKADADTNDARKKGAIVFERTGSFGTGDLKFLTSDDASEGNVNTTETRMTILSTGEVGIGTDSPQAALHVVGSDGSGSAAPLAANISAGTGASGDPGYDGGQISLTTGKGGDFSGAFAGDAGDGGSLLLTTGDGGDGGPGLGNGGDGGNIILMPGSGGVLGSGGGSSGSSGKVGIGTSSPGARFHVSGGNILLDNNQELQFKNSSGTATEAFRLDPNNDLVIGDTAGIIDGLIFFAGGTRAMDIQDTTGRVGIGTNNPQQELHVQGSIIANGSNEGYYVGTSAGAIYKSLYVDTSNSEGLGTNGLFLATSGGSEDMRFKVGGSTKMSILDDGKVGIGTDSPDDFLEIEGGLQGNGIHLDSTSGAGINIDRGATNNHYRLMFSTAGDEKWAIGNKGESDEDLGFYATGSGIANVMFESSGDVGIGTTAPSTRLDVNGTFQASNAYFYAYDNTGGTTVSTNWTSIPFDTEIREDSLYTHATTGDSSNVTIGEAGWYEVTAQCMADVSGTARYTVLWRLRNNGVEIDGSRAASYHRADTDGLDTGTINLLHEFSANDKVELQGLGDDASAITTVADGCRMTIKRI